MICSGSSYLRIAARGARGTPTRPWAPAPARLLHTAVTGLPSRLPGQVVVCAPVDGATRLTSVTSGGQLYRNGGRKRPTPRVV